MRDYFMARLASSLSVSPLHFLTFFRSVATFAQLSAGKMPETELQRKVVLGVDGSEHSERAFDWYVKNVSDKVKDILLIIHAREMPSNSAAPYASYGYWYYEEWQQMVEKSAKQARQLLETYAIKCREHGINFKLYKEQSNSPGEVICKLAEDEKAHCIVVGSRGVGKVRRKFLGSVSEYCVHHTPHIPVVAVPPIKNNNQP